MRVIQWFRDKKPIRGTRGVNEYIVTEKDFGKEISMRFVKTRKPRKRKKRDKHLIHG